MKLNKRIWIVCIVIAIVFSLSGNALAIDTNETENNVEDIVSSQPITENDSLLSDDGVSTMSIENPVKAYMAVNTYSYAAPSSTTGHTQEIIPGNTNVWVVEKVWCDSQSKYYFYVGYTYNSESHRGYVPSENVYKNGSRYTHDNVPSETKPANLKVHTSLAGTVYDGPADTYSVTGSVGQESIKLIRTEGDYNFIEYTVSSTGKLKRGFLHYSLITGSWENLTDQLADDLDGKTFYIKNTLSGKYLEIPNASTTQRTQAVTADFHGGTHQIFKFTYYSDAHCFKIQPAYCYENDMLLTQSILETEHSQRDTMLYPRRAKTYQRYWIVKRAGTTDCYKIVAVSSYGTMTLTTRIEGTSYNVCQDYTGMSTGDVSYDIWQFVDTTKIFDNNEITRYKQDKSNWCWVAAAKTAASTETPFYATISQAAVVEQIKGSVVNETGSQTEKTKASNYYVSQNLNSGDFVAKNNQYYSEEVIRRFIMDGHAINISVMSINNGSGHSVVIMGFKWVDQEDCFMYYFLDPWNTASSDPQPILYSTLTKYSTTITSYGSVWKHCVVYSTSYAAQTVAFIE